MALAAFGLVMLTGAARADQLVLTDTTYTHRADNTSDSHYYVQASGETPKNLKSPVDYSKGSVHIALDVASKPAGETPTRFQICLEGSPGYVCPLTSPIYTKTGHLEWSDPVSNWYVGNGGIDWSKPLVRLDLIVKTADYGKPQSDPKFVPTDLHVVAVLLSAGASYVAPGDGDPATMPTLDAGRPAGATRDAAAGMPDAAVRARTDAATRGDAATRADAALPEDGDDSPGNEDAPEHASKESSGCRLADGSARTAWPLVALAGLSAVGSKRRRRQAS